MKVELLYFIFSQAVVFITIVKSEAIELLNECLKDLKVFHAGHDKYLESTVLSNYACSEICPLMVIRPTSVRTIYLL